MAVPSSFDQLKEWFASYTLSQKVAIIGSAALSVVLLWTLVYFVNQVDYQILYSELEPADAQGVVERLQGMAIEYQISDDGSTIRVSRDRLSEARIQLASEGLPSSGRIGFEIFDRTSFGLTNFQEQINFQRALEGELARSITTLSEVDVARVHLVLPSDSLFQSDSEQTKASIILRLKRGNALSDSAVNGIVHLVASSVKGLEASRVTVVDYAGRMLSRNDEGGPASGQQLDTRVGVEDDLANKITQILEPVVGTGKVRPQVSLVMNWEQVEETVEAYDPAASVVRSQQRRTERAPGATQDQAIGVPGPQGQILDPLALTLPAAGTGDFVSEDEVVNYEVSKSVRHVVSPTGAIEKMSVAVIIDNRTEITIDENGVATPVSQPWTPEEMTKYRDLVAATVGFTPERGDSLIVENVSFGNESLPFEPATMLERQAPLILMALRYLIIPIVFLFAYLLFLRPLQKTVFAKWEPQLRPQLTAGQFAPAGMSLGPGVMAGGQIAAPAFAGQGSTPPLMMDAVQTPVSIGQLEQQLTAQPLPALPGQQAGTIPAVGEDGGSPEREFLPLPSSNKVDMIRSRIVEHAKREPETVARLVRVWLNEEKQ